MLFCKSTEIPPRGHKPEAPGSLLQPRNPWRWWSSGVWTKGWTLFFSFCKLYWKEREQRGGDKCLPLKKTPCVMEILTTKNFWADLMGRILKARPSDAFFNWSCKCHGTVQTTARQNPCTFLPWIHTASYSAHKKVWHQQELNRFWQGGAGLADWYTT